MSNSSSIRVKATSSTATAAMAGSRFSLIPSQMRRGSVKTSRLAMNSTITSSSQEWMKAKIAPDAIPGAMRGRITQRSVCARDAPIPRAACSRRGSKAASAVATVMTT